MAIIIDGNAIARAIIKKLRALIKDAALSPGVAAILIGEDEASKIYIREKQKKSKKIGIAFHLFTFQSDVSESVVLQRIQTLNADQSIHGIIVQFPIPSRIDADALIAAIDPKKDADGFHPKNIASFLRIHSFENILEQNILVPVTPVAIIEIIRYVKGLHPNPNSLKKILLVGKCSVFVEPLIRYFQLTKKTRFEMISPDDPRLLQKTREADILIAAIGRPRFITKEMVGEGAVVIDVGTSRVRGKIVGDVDFERVAPKVSFITPPTGGVGPVTVAVLMRNVVCAATFNKHQKSVNSAF